MRTVVSCALGECVHVAGVSNFLRLAEAADELCSRGVRFVFGCTPPVVKLARKLNCYRIN
ncbi:MAG: hypothetical protein KAV87_56955 [Desulfobacteraceae bacterium]|nr:hypothetical protein [Desulfobacteraceae bacterium]